MSNSDTAASRAFASAAEPVPAAISAGRLWTSRILQALVVLFLLFDAAGKLLKPPAVVKATIELGYPESTIIGIGVVLLLSTILYVIPRTAIWGAIFLTGYLGGAVASMVRAGMPAFNHIFPLLIAVLLWGALVLRNRRLAALLF